MSKFLLPKSISSYNLEEYPIVFTDEAADQLSLIPQVRKIEKHIKKLLRKAAVQIKVYKKDEVTIDGQFIEEDDIKTTPKIGFKL